MWRDCPTESTEDSDEEDEFEDTFDDQNKMTKQSEMQLMFLAAILKTIQWMSMFQAMMRINVSWSNFERQVAVANERNYIGKIWREQEEKREKYEIEDTEKKLRAKINKNNRIV